jgi:hypothetical protein
VNSLTARRLWLLAAGALATVAVALLISATSQAAFRITVNTTADNAPSGSECSGAPGDCSVRQAVDKASTGGTVSIPANSSHYSISLGEIALTKDLTISGGGARSVVIDATGGASRIFSLAAANTVTISGVTLTGGAPSAPGGAIEVTNGNLTVTDSDLTGNDASTFVGGAIRQSGGVLTIQRSTISKNHAGDGGGLDLDNGTTTVSNTTISDNQGFSNGAAVDTDGSGTIAFTNDTIVRNTGAADGGISDDATRIQMQNTLLAFNGPKDCEQTESPRSLGNNLDSDGTCFPTGGGSTTADPKIGTLANNGGPTDTVKLNSGSDAIDAGATVGSITTDQRGVPRPQPAGGHYDIGAYEFALAIAATGPANFVTSNSAQVTGSVTPYPSASAFFQYGTTTAYGAQTSPRGVSSATAISAVLSGLAANTEYHYRVVAEDADGTQTGADMTFTTALPGAPLRPVLSHVSQAFTSWAEPGNPRGVHITRRGPHIGTTFKFTLNEAARVRFDFTRPAPGRRVNGRCVKPSKHNKHKRKCTRTVIKGTFSFLAHAGVNTVKFQGKLPNGRKLKLGKYKLVITATSFGGSTSKSLRFKIVKRH